MGVMRQKDSILDHSADNLLLQARKLLSCHLKVALLGDSPAMRRLVQEFPPLLAHSHVFHFHPYT